MSSTASGEERLRLFVALELPCEVRGALARWGSYALAGLEGWRGVRADSLHVTLCFLGWRAAGEAEETALACAAVSERPAPGLAVGAVLALPPRRPRVLAVSLADPGGGLAAVQRELAGLLADAGLYTPEQRPFLPHVTVARVRGTPPRRAPELPAPTCAPFTASRVVLYRSRLGRGGSRYEALATVELRGRA